MERFVGDFGIARDLKLTKLSEEKFPEKIAIIGSGPAGLSCAYQLSRRGYPVTVYEAFSLPGGMLRYGIPKYRLPWNVLDAEINRILDLEKKTPFLNQSYSFGLGNRIELGDKGRALGFNLSVSYSKDQDYYSNGKKYYYEIAHIDHRWRDHCDVVWSSETRPERPLGGDEFSTLDDKKGKFLVEKWNVQLKHGNPRPLDMPRTFKAHLVGFVGLGNELGEPYEGEEFVAPGVVLRLAVALGAGQTGKEILYPLAIVVIGGLLSSTLLDQIVTPALFYKFGRK